MQKILTIIVLVSAALWGLSSCEGSYMDPGAMGMIGSGGFGGGDHDYDDYDDDGSSGNSGGGGGNSGGGGSWKGALTNENLGVNDDSIDWKCDATDYQLQFSYNEYYKSLYVAIFSSTDNPGLSGAVKITGNTMTVEGVSCSIYMADNLQRIKIEGLTGTHQKKNGEYRKR